jgi:hypothetical protein
VPHLCQMHKICLHSCTCLLCPSGGIQSKITLGWQRSWQWWRIIAERSHPARSRCSVAGYVESSCCPREYSAKHVLRLITSTDHLSPTAQACILIPVAYITSSCSIYTKKDQYSSSIVFLLFTTAHTFITRYYFNESISFYWGFGEQPECLPVILSSTFSCFASSCPLCVIAHILSHHFTKACYVIPCFLSYFYPCPILFFTSTLIHPF